MENNLYQEIAERTDGDIYIGVVGPVRSGKSSFIKRFMDKLVIPNIENQHKRNRAIDELPQSAHGRTIMTTEPKFVPNEAVEIRIGDQATFKVRMVDCVGYVVPSAAGYIENEMPRMVATPWFEEEIPFEKAAEIGTKKVITEHSTIGLVITTDGSISEIPRFDYIEAEDRVISELKAINKPFIVLLNSADPRGEECQRIKREIEEKHNVSVMELSCTNLGQDQISEIIERVLFEFPINEICLRMPSWFNSIDSDHWLKTDLIAAIRESSEKIRNIREARIIIDILRDNPYLSRVDIDNIDLGKGKIYINLTTPEELFYKILSEHSGVEVADNKQLMSIFSEFAKIKSSYDKISGALQQVQERGYGIVFPTMDELTLEEPKIVRQGNKYGVSLRASAPSIHMIRADIETEVNPIVGTERQSEELVHYLLREFDEDPSKIWSSNIFGKSLHELVNEGLKNKLAKMPDDAQMKLQETLSKIINEGSGGLICIIL